MLLGFEQMKLSGFEPDPDLKWERIGDVPAPERLMMASKATSAGLMVFVTPVAIDSKHRILLIEDIFEDEIDESYVRLFDTRTRKLSDEAWRSLNQPREYFGCVVCNGKSICYRRTRTKQ
jgi:hypothetical protein